ncbi:MAG: hypothetical protein IJP86_09505 [Synergistaceae bacterium]|nr:hypothetical protein [Synergistaceae bacterium]
MFYPQFSYTFNVNANTYTINNEANLVETYIALDSVSVNGTDITSTLTQQE